MTSRGRVKTEGLGKDFVIGGETLTVLDGVGLDIAAGEAVVITGPSGTGKSTLLHLLGTLERPTRGEIEVDGRRLGSLDDDEIAEFRNREVGFVFQDHHLLPQYSVLQNVILPSLAFGGVASRVEERARELLGAVGLAERLDHRPAQLSGGERQRAAIARSLINDPSVLLCDEPTGNLDPTTAARVSDLLFDLHERSETTLIAVTHSRELAGRFPRRFDMSDGDVEEVREGEG